MGLRGRFMLWLTRGGRRKGNRFDGHRAVSEDGVDGLLAAGASHRWTWETGGWGGDVSVGCCGGEEASASRTKADCCIIQCFEQLCKMAALLWPTTVSQN